MLNREVSGLGLLEAAVVVVLLLMTAAFIVSGAPDPGRYAIGAGGYVVAFICFGVVRRRRRRESSGESSSAAQATASGDPAGGALGYRGRQALLALVAPAMGVAFILVEGRWRVTFGFFVALSLALIVNLERLRPKDDGC